MSETLGQQGVALRLRRLPFDTGRENMAVISNRSTLLRPDLFRGFSRVVVRAGGQELIASLITSDQPGLPGPNELGLAEPAFRRLGLPEGTEIRLAPAIPPESLDGVRRKIAGETLDDDAIKAIIDDLAAYRYSDIETTAFLVGVAGFLSTGELFALTRAMADAGTKLAWDHPVVVDKHCIGGIPGNRTSMLVVPIVAAHGLIMPKTSSRAITSPAGTADTMEVLARVDLGTEEMRQVVEACGGCLVWGGHVRLSPADDVLIGVERPLGIDTRELMVASILSKKLAAGSTHLLIDIPVGPHAKVPDANNALRLRKLFELLGDRLGIATEVVLTDGRQPIGDGVGPLLESRDVMAVLQGDPAAPADLREKSLRLAGRILENDPQLRGGTGYARARTLLETGAAMKTMQRIIDAQGPPPTPSTLGSHTADIPSPRDGVISAIDNLRINRLARLAGAPLAKGAGLSLFRKIGARVEQGEPLYRIHAAEPFEFDFARAAANHDCGYHFEAPPS